MTPTSPDDRDVVVALRDASFGYADRRVVAGVDLDVRRGDVVALLGPNGCGKSTLVKGLLGLNEHVGGSVELFGRPLGRFRDRSRLGYVPQRHTLSASVAATVGEIVATGRLPHQGLLARPNRTDRRIIAESLDLVGLADRARDDVSALSGGQQRRVLIARALAARPDVLVMDEPMAGVDAASQRALEGVLGRLADRDAGGTTMLIVTHEVAPLRPILTRAVTMSAGRIVFDGPADRLDERGDLTGDWLGPRAPGHHHSQDDDAPENPAGAASLGLAAPRIHERRSRA